MTDVGTFRHLSIGRTAQQLVVRKAEHGALGLVPREHERRGEGVREEANALSSAQVGAERNGAATR